MVEEMVSDTQGLKKQTSHAPFATRLLEDVHQQNEQRGRQDWRKGSWNTGERLRDVLGESVGQSQDESWAPIQEANCRDGRTQDRPRKMPAAVDPVDRSRWAGPKILPVSFFLTLGRWRFFWPCCAACISGIVLWPISESWTQAPAS